MAVAAVAAVVAVAVVAVEEEEEEAEEEPLLDPPCSQENWEAIHQKSSTETGKKANHSY